MAYKDLLLDPRWQRKRLEVLERADFTCDECRSKEKTLHVHHTYYAKGRKPWEYDESDLRCLCVDCHAIAGSDMEEIQRGAGALGAAERGWIRGFIKGITGYYTNSEIELESHDVIAGVAAAYGITTSDIYRLSEKDDYDRVDRKALRDRSAFRQTVDGVHDAIEHLESLQPPESAAEAGGIG